MVRTAGGIDRTVLEGGSAAKYTPLAGFYIYCRFLRGPCPCAACLVYGARISIVTARLRTHVQRGLVDTWLYLGEKTTTYTRSNSVSDDEIDLSNAESSAISTLIGRVNQEARGNSFRVRRSPFPKRRSAEWRASEGVQLVWCRLNFLHPLYLAVTIKNNTRLAASRQLKRAKKFNLAMKIFIFRDEKLRTSPRLHIPVCN